MYSDFELRNEKRMLCLLQNSSSHSVGVNSSVMNFVQSNIFAVAHDFTLGSAKQRTAPYLV